MTIRPRANSSPRIFGEQGFAVQTASRGIDGLKLARDLHPAAITLDILMPDIDGWTVLAALKGDPALADIPVIIVTILDEQRRGITLGAAGYLTKPIDRQRLLGIMDPYRVKERRALFLLLMMTKNTESSSARPSRPKVGWSEKR